MNLVLDLVLLCLGLPVLAAATYLLLATILSRKLPLPPFRELGRRFRFIVPAHNESAGIAATVKKPIGGRLPTFAVRRLGCSGQLRRRHGRAGACRRRGRPRASRHRTTSKGYALLLAVFCLPVDLDAVVVIDADTVVSSNILQAFAARLDSGALAIQADYAVRNPNAGWRTRLIAIAFGAFHIVRSRGARAAPLVLWASRQRDVLRHRAARCRATRGLFHRRRRGVRHQTRRGRIPSTLRRRGARVWGDGV